jgi:ceramide glucosyltransferase
VVLNCILGVLATLSFLLLLWQWVVATRFPLHRREPQLSFRPGVTLLKPLKGCDEATETCLRSWFQQQYGGPLQILFAVASSEDPVCEVVNKLIREFRQSPETDHRPAELVVCGPLLGANAKVSKLVQLAKRAEHDLLVLSDADVRVAPDFLANLVQPFKDESVRLSGGRASEEEHRENRKRCGLVNCFYSLRNPSTMAMQWEAVAINADFWSQVLQARSLRPIDFALGAVMAVRKQQLAEIGGFESLVDCLADDYQLGNRISRKGYLIEISSVPVECWSQPMGWREVWKHQLRWARTIRVSQPVPYFFSILSNATLWPALWMLVRPGVLSFAFGAVCFCARLAMAVDLQRRLLQGRIKIDPHGSESSRRSSSRSVSYAWMALVKDGFQTAIWFISFMGNRVEWRGEKLRLKADGTLAIPKPRMTTN